MNERDDELARALGRSLEAVPATDAEAALVRVTARSRIVRRRRAATRVGIVLAAVGAASVLWLVVRPPGETKVDTVDSPSTASSIAGTTVPSTVGSTTTLPSIPSTPTTLPAAVPAPSTSTAPPPAPTAPAGGGPAVTTAPTPTATAPPGTTAPPSIGPSTYGGVGGQVTVRVDAGSLVLLSVQPTAGYVVAEQRTAADEVEVRFEGPAGRTRVRVRLRDGQLEPEVQENGP